jgi:hypothetical protein
MYDNPQGDLYAGTLYMNVFAVENNIDGSESSGDYAQVGDIVQPYKHPFVVRAAINPNHCFGDAISSGGTIPDNDVIRKEFKIKKDPAWNLLNLHFAAGLWIRTGGASYVYVNAYDNRRLY